MAIPAVATQQNVFAAADKLLLETGQVPTLQAVREAVGGGSYKTLGDLMRLWKAQHREQRPVKEALPMALQERVLSLSSEFWSVAIELAQQRLDAERQALTEAKDEAVRDAAEAYKAADDAQRRLELANTVLIELRTQLTESQQNEKSTAAELAITRTQLDQLRAELATERTARIESVAAIAAANARAESADAERQRLSELLQSMTSKPARRKTQPNS